MQDRAHRTIMAAALPDGCRGRLYGCEVRADALNCMVSHTGAKLGSGPPCLGRRSHTRVLVQLPFSIVEHTSVTYTHTGIHTHPLPLPHCLSPTWVDRRTRARALIRGTMPTVLMVTFDRDNPNRDGSTIARTAPISSS